MVRVNGEKMSKSLGNFTTIRDLLETVEPMVIRLFILQAQYRKPLDFTDEAIASATSGWQTFNDGLTFGDRFGVTLGWDVESSATAEPLPEVVEKFRAAMDDDFNSSAALAILFELAKDLRRAGNLLVHGEALTTPVDTLRHQWTTLVELADVLGLVPTLAIEREGEAGLTDAAIEALIAQRQQARVDRNFAESDRIRDELKAQGITLIDKPDGTVFVRD
jgi:cysteinyl-tRNA synthetase